MGVVFSAFSWTYFLGQVPSGVLLDRFGTRAIYSLSLLAWSLATLLHAAATGFGSLLGLRLALGLAEAPCFPANSDVVAKWFPRSERGRAIGVYTAAEYVGLSFMSPVLFWILNAFGWRALFGAAGAIGVAAAFVFARQYRDPADHPSVSRSELAYVAAGGGDVGRTAPVRFELHHVRALFRHRRMWGLCIGQYAVYSTFVFFLTWFPTYLATERHMDWIRVGIFTALPYIAGFFGILFAGWWSDRMLAGGQTLNVARKLPVIAGLIGASTIAAANYVESDGLVIAILSVAFFCAGDVLVRLDGHFRGGTTVAARPRVRALQRIGQPVGDRHAARDRDHPAGDGLVLRCAGVRRRRCAGRGLVLDLSDRRCPADGDAGLKACTTTGSVPTACRRAPT